MCVRHVFALVCFYIALGMGGHALAHDSQNHQEPRFPKVCKVLRAPLRWQSDQPILKPGLSEDQESSRETWEVQAALNKCAKVAPGSAVRLALGRDESFNAFLVNPLNVPSGVSLLIEGGVTVYGSKNADNYSSHLPNVTCGGKGPPSVYPVDGGCNPLITLNSHTGIYGYGVIDGRGGVVYTGAQAPGISWWTLTTTRGQDEQQASPYVVGLPGETAEDVTLYKVTVRNPPFHTMKLTGNGILVWGVKVQAPWDVPNTDGFDVSGQNITIFDSTVANGDQEVAIFAGAGGTQNVKVENLRGYNKGGVAILVNGFGPTVRPVQDVVIRSAFITGELPSFFRATFKGKSEPFVNGVPESEMLRKYGAQGITSFTQALPNATDVHGLQITANLSKAQSEDGPVGERITFESVCMQDVGEPLNVSPESGGEAVGAGFKPPVLRDIVFKDVHVLKPTSQYVTSVGGSVPTLGGGYRLSFLASPHTEGGVGFRNHLTFENVVFDDDSSGSSIASIDAEGNRLSTLTNVYPAVLNGLFAKYSASPVVSQNGNTALTLNDNRYVRTTPINDPSLAYKCSSKRPPFVMGELYLSLTDDDSGGRASSELQTATVPAGSNITLNAVVQPIMSESTYLNTRAPATTVKKPPPFLAIGSPRLTNPVIFFERGRPVGYGRLLANGTLARAVIRVTQPGMHTYTAQYPADVFYETLDFGSVTVTVKADRRGNDKVGDGRTSPFSAN
jgi:polygalacturonase